MFYSLVVNTFIILKDMCVPPLDTCASFLGPCTPFLGPCAPLLNLCTPLLDACVPPWIHTRLLWTRARFAIQFASSIQFAPINTYSPFLLVGLPFMEMLEWKSISPFSMSCQHSVLTPIGRTGPTGAKPVLGSVV
jgi:hypothetical protein